MLLRQSTCLLFLFFLFFFLTLLLNETNCQSQQQQQDDVEEIDDDDEEDEDDSSNNNYYKQQLLLRSNLVQNRPPVGHKGKRPNKISSSSSDGSSMRGSDRFVKKRGMHHLMKYIFANYNKELMPARPVYVKLDVLLLKVKSTVEKEGIFESVIALFIEWFDPRMIWDPADYDNVTVLAFDSERVWLPDIAMTNSADHLYGISRDTRFVVRVTNDGLFKFVPTGTAKTWCELNLLTFPFDMQTCSLEFESWSLDSSTMAFREQASIIVDNNFLSTQWTLCRKNATVYSVYYEFSGETFSRVKFDFTVRRKSTFYLINLVFPCATLSAIQLLVFAIPSMDCSSDRIGFGTTNLLTLVVFQTIVTEEMPKTSDAVTALSKYIIALIILSAVGIFESVCVERMRRIKFQAPPRNFIRFARTLPLFWLHNSRPDYSSIFIAPGCGIAEEDDEVSSVASLKGVISNNNSNNSSNASKQAAGQFDVPKITPTKEPSPIGKMASVTFGDDIPYIEQGTSNSPSVVFANERPSHLPLRSLATKRPSPDHGYQRQNLHVNPLVPTLSTKTRQASLRQRKVSRFTAAKEHQARRDFIESQYAELWGEIATRLDVVTFVFCTISAIAVPLMLFLPLLYFGDDCILEPAK